jgi:hypothetical protein
MIAFRVSTVQVSPSRIEATPAVTGRVDERAAQSVGCDEAPPRGLAPAATRM